MFRTFRRDPAKGAEHAPSDPVPRSTTLIAEGVLVSGDLSGTGEVQVDGRIEGRVRLTGELIVTARGQIEGPVEATTVRIAGTVKGSVRGAERIEVAASGRVEGDITSKRVAISEGALLAGEVAMLTEPPARGLKN